jgi:LCP family protein required for cell wall assembly
VSGNPPIRRREVARRRDRQRIQKIAIRVVLYLVTAALVAGASLVGYGAYVAAQFDDSVNVIDEPFVDQTARPTPTDFGALNLLLMGTDTRGSLGKNLNATGSRSDTIMFVHVAGDRSSVQVISLPRDSWVPIKGYGMGKINWALSYGGVKLAVDTVEKLLNAQIDHVAMIDFTGVKTATKVIGGVQVDNPVSFDVFDGRLEHFRKGPIVLEGDRALMFVRERHSFAEGDVSRIQNQQRFIKGFIDKILSIDVLANPDKLAKLARSIGKSMLVDKGLNSGFIVTLGAQLAGISGDSIQFFTLPFTGAGMVGDQFVVHVDRKNLRELRKNLRKDTLATYEQPPLPATSDWP